MGGEETAGAGQEEDLTLGQWQVFSFSFIGTFISFIKGIARGITWPEINSDLGKTSWLCGSKESDFATVKAKKTGTLDLKKQTGGLDYAQKLNSL